MMTSLLDTVADYQTRSCLLPMMTSFLDTVGSGIKGQTFCHARSGKTEREGDFKG